MKRYIYAIMRLIKIYILRDKFLIATKQWFADNGDKTLRLDYNLNENSIVFDIGGYEGTFAQNIVERYNSTVYIFEPVTEFYNKISDRFSNSSKIKVFNFGLSNKTKYIEIALSDDASSIHIDSNKKERIKLVNIVEFIRNNNIQRIDLMKINIEGGEFDILPELIDSKIIESIENIQIQFHSFIDDSKYKREMIREKLALTHELTYDYYFIWENWRKKQ